MKFLLVMLFAFSFAQEAEQAPAALQRAEIIFLKKKKEFAKLTMEDTASGIKSVFISEKLDKGTFVLKIVDTCGAKTATVIGEFFTSSGNTSSEFINVGLSVGERNKSVNKKFVTLSKKSKGGKTSLEACAEVKMAE